MTSAEDVIKIVPDVVIESVKILVCGDVKGQFDSLFKKVATVNSSKAGPFDLLLCVGNFFEKPKALELADASTAVAHQQLNEYISGFKRVPIPTYFITGPDEEKLMPGSREQVCENLFYLGRFGIAKLKGLSIAYISGKFGNSKDESSSFLRGDIESLVSTWAVDERRGVDVLLTNEWPLRCLSNVPSELQPHASNGRPFARVGSAGTAMVARILKPRYHFVGVEDLHYARPPYVNRAHANDYERTNATRLVALAHAFNTDNQKFLVAYTLQPLRQMEDNVLFEKPADATDSPYIAPAVDASTSKSKSNDADDDEPYTGEPNAKRLRVQPDNPSGFVRSGAGGVSTAPLLMPPVMFPRWGADVDASMAGAPFRGGRGRGGGNRGGRGGRGRGGGASNNSNMDANRAKLISAGDCWFCLQSPHVEKHLVVSVAPDVYVTLAKGGLVDDHLLIVAVEHVMSYDEAAPDTKAQVDKYKTSIKQYYARDGHEALFFERFIIVKDTCHMHLQAVPMPANSVARARAAFVAHGARQQMTFADGTASANGGPYFRVELHDGSILTHVIDLSRRFDLQFGRVVCAELLGMPERVDWKRCAPGKEAEIVVCARVRAAFAAFDWSLADE